MMTPEELRAFVEDQARGAESSNEHYKSRGSERDARFWEGYASAMHVVRQKLTRDSQRPLGYE